jgi:acetolactate synthase-1/2/3 large subunit
MGGFALLVSSTVDHTRTAGGGLWAVQRGEVHQVDAISTTGIASAGDYRVIRALQLTDVATLDGAVLDYRVGGDVRLRRTTGYGDIHDVRFLSSGPTAVASYQNAVVPLELGNQGPLRLPGEPDSWHLNCIEEADGNLFATAFRCGGRYRQWAEPGREPEGLLFRLDTRQVLLRGLSAPHNPKLIEEGWLVCNSGTNELLLFDREPPHRLLRRLSLRSWTRGLAVHNDLIYVGESTRRREEDSHHASVAIVSRSAWAVLDRVPIPTGEIYDLLFVPGVVVDDMSARAPEATALATRFCRAHPIRGGDSPARSQDQRTGSGDVDRTHGVALNSVFPENTWPGALFHVRTSVMNRGKEVLPAKGPNLMTVGFRWFDETGSEVELSLSDQHMRTPLPRDLPPGHCYELPVRVRAPLQEGRFMLSVSVVHELVAWLDDLDPESAARGHVVVTSHRSPTSHMRLAR